MSLSRIALYLESEDSNTSYMDFPKSGTMRSGNVYEVVSLDCNNAADSIQRNFKLQQLEYGLSLRDSLILK